MDEKELRNLLAEHIGVGIHTTLRKGTDSKEGSMAWRAIDEMADGEWGSVVDYVAGVLMKVFDIEIKEVE